MSIAPTELVSEKTTFPITNTNEVCEVKTLFQSRKTNFLNNISPRSLQSPVRSEPY
jgi:hypothetical protein